MAEANTSVEDKELCKSKEFSQDKVNIKRKTTVDETGFENRIKHPRLEANEKSYKIQDTKSSAPEFSSHVAQHYNELENTGLDSRKESKIYYMRNFNNWVKGTLISKYLNKLGRVRNVLDLCCGKGGDLLKWNKGNIKHLICADIAWKSVEQCESRYNDIRNRTPHVFTSEFITADCTRVCLREKFQNPNIELDLVSCQFSFHYCFESLPQAERMLKNASECLKVGGYFIGTMPNSNEIVKRMRKNGTNILKSKIFSIEMCSEEPYPLFGAQYHFNLDSVVDCPEFLVHFPTLIKLAGKYDLTLDYKDSFADFYNTHCNDSSRKSLLKKMVALQPFSLSENPNMSDDEYLHAEKYCRDHSYTGTVGTISKSEWEAISIYQVFAFKKVAAYANDTSTSTQLLKID